MIFYNEVEIAIVKLAVANMENLGLYGDDILLQSVCWLRDKYEITYTREYLIKAIWHIFAYLELGYSFENIKDLTTTILKDIELNIEDVFPMEKIAQTKIVASKSNIKNLLGRWNPVLHCMKINDVVADIINKIYQNKEGEYTYYCGKKIKSNEVDTLWECTYKLYIKNDNAIFYDVNKFKYYALVKR